MTMTMCGREAENADEGEVRMKMRIERKMRARKRNQLRECVLTASHLLVLLVRRPTPVMGAR